MTRSWLWEDLEEEFQAEGPEGWNGIIEAPRTPRRATDQGRRGVGIRAAFKKTHPHAWASVGEASRDCEAQMWGSEWGLLLSSPWQPKFGYQYLLSCAQEESKLAGSVGAEPGLRHPPSRSCDSCP